MEKKTFITSLSKLSSDNKMRQNNQKWYEHVKLDRSYSLRLSKVLPMFEKKKNTNMKNSATVANASATSPAVFMPKLLKALC